MPIIAFSARDLLRGTVVEPAWYRCVINEVTESPSSDKKSINYPVECTIIKNADNGDVKFAEVPITFNFNSKALGFVKGYYMAMGIELLADQRYDLGNTAGQIIDIYIENDIYDNRPVNRVNHKYRPASKE